ncbi:MAG: ABC transporter substrate-binding protein [Candidatus Parcubacteria bacterium]|nr:ABC transporter substrate-binding protein [Candidatus Parcubacteria bacterium]
MENMKKLISLILVFTLLAAIATGCNKKTTETTEEPPAVVRTVTVTDMSGDTVTITGEVKKIVNLWPAGTSSFFVMGAGDLIIGLASNTPGTMNSWTQLFYPNCVNIPALGGTTPTIENIINLKPDLVIIHPTTAAAGFAKQIRNVGIPAININFTNYETMIKAYTILGEVLGGDYQKKLSTWCSAVETKLANVRRLTTGIADANRPVVYYISGQSDSLTATMDANSIIQDWVESAGGVYAAKVMGLTAAQVTPEAVFNLNPDVIICGGVYQHVEENAVKTKNGWKDLKAVKTNRVYTNPYGCFNWERFGLESQMQITYAFMCLQPTIATNGGMTRTSMISEIINFYKTYNGYTLNQTQAGYMLDGLRPDGTAEYPVK